METARAVARISRTYPALPESIPLARAAVAAFAAEAGATEEQREGVRLVVSEAVTNAVLHAYPDTPGDVHVTAVVVCDELWILIADDGRGLSVRGESPGLGLGLVWMAEFSDGMTLMTRSSGGVEVRLRYALEADAPVNGELDAYDSRARVAGLC
jgi:stage II sporulation protein AB (anti-sigma F factor)